MQSFPPAFLPSLPARIPLRLPPSRANVGLGAGAYFPSPLFSRLHDLASLSFFFPRSSVSLPAFLLSRPPPSPQPSLPLSPTPPSSPSCRYTPHLFLLFRRSLYTVGCIATFACRFIGNANFLPVHPSNRTAQTTPLFARGFRRYP